MKKRQLVKSMKSTYNVAKPLCGTFKTVSGSCGTYTGTGNDTDILF